MDYRSFGPGSGANQEEDAMQRKRQAMAQMLASGAQGGGTPLSILSNAAMGAAQGYRMKQAADARLLKNQIATANTTSAPLDSLIQQRNAWQSTPTATAMPVAQTAAMYGPQSLNGAP